MMCPASACLAGTSTTVPARLFEYVSRRIPHPFEALSTASRLCAAGGPRPTSTAPRDEQGVYFLDEAEAALSFHSCLGLVSLLDTMRREGSQVIVATHSPLLVSLPDATLLQLGEQGITKLESYDELALVKDWRAFLSGPGRYLRHLVEEPQ